PSHHYLHSFPTRRSSDLKSLDNRISVYILIEALRKLAGTELPFPVDAVFTVQEEVGLRGAINAAGHINPRFGLNLDVTIAYDVRSEEHTSELQSRENLVC